MSNGASGSNRRVKDRIDLNRDVQLRFQKFQDFLTEIAGNISPGGMFVRSDDPHEVGEQFEFECSLADGYPLVSGRAEVVWTRRRAQSADQPSGMGVRFLELRDKSEMLIRRIVEQRIEAGEEPFELAGGSSEARPEAAGEEPSLTEEILAAAEGLTKGAPHQAEPESPRTVKDDAPVVPGPEPSPPAILIETAPVAQRPVPATATSEVTPKRASPPKAPPVLERPSAQAAKPPASHGPSVPGVPPLAVELPAQEPLRRAGESPESSAPSAASRSGRSRGRRLGIVRLLELLLISILAGGCMALAFNQYWVRPRIESLEARLDELTGSSQVGGAPGFGRAMRDAREHPDEVEPKGAGAEGASVPAEVLVASEAAGAREPRQTLQEAVQGWASAWSEQRVEDYLSYYSADFAPATGMPRAAWEERRRERLSAQGAIRVAVVSLEIEELSQGEARALFTQSYQSNAYRDRVRKALRMSWTDDRWQIVEEAVIRQLPW